jgi:6-phosphogluconate dehydrogenase
MVEMAWKTGDPGIVFLDRINRDNPTPLLGRIESTNPCGEQPLLPYESCNLGSLNLARMVRYGPQGAEIDWEKMARVISTAVHMLDNVIDRNNYPIPAIDQMSKKTRRLGLGVMGQNLALNLAEKGVPVAGYDPWPGQVDAWLAKAGTAPVGGFKSMAEFVQSLVRPRRIIILLKAGEVVDKAIASLTPLLEQGDTIIDGGNERYRNTERRQKEIAPHGIAFLGMGISGGEEGARHGPSLMPGGDRAGYDELAPLLSKIAAQADGPCVTYVGTGGSGHFVKMVHNGIEYGDMQLVAEAYDVLRSIGGLSNRQLADVFADWNRGELQSFLIEITARIFAEKDPETGKDLIDLVVDAAAMKGTGTWTAIEAEQMGVAVPTLIAAVDARAISANRALRMQAAEILIGPPRPTVPLSAPERKQLIDDVRAALYCAKTCSYAQGFDLLSTASKYHQWDLKLGELARIWRAGCIIRAQFLGRIQAAFGRDAQLGNLLLDATFREELGARQAGWRRVTALAVSAGIPALCLGSSLSYYDMIRCPRLPLNLVQAQRDYFGAHTYERTDKEGKFHTEWGKA